MKKIVCDSVWLVSGQDQIRIFSMSVVSHGIFECCHLCNRSERPLYYRLPNCTKTPIGLVIDDGLSVTKSIQRVLVALFMK